MKSPTCFSPRRTILREFVKPCKIYTMYNVTFSRLDKLPEDGPTGTETCQRFYGIFSILMCMNIF